MRFEYIPRKLKGQNFLGVSFVQSKPLRRLLAVATST
jgi:hypothetical protein